jgi:hypothetical protein
MKNTYTVDEFQENFDELFARVENGEILFIEYENKKFAMIPYKNLNINEDTIDIFFDHDDAC